MLNEGGMYLFLKRKKNYYRKNRNYNVCRNYIVVCVLHVCFTTQLIVNYITIPIT